MSLTGISLNFISVFALLLSLGLLVDDTMENIEAAEKAGVKTLVFPRPWNNSKLTVNQLLDEVLSHL